MGANDPAMAGDSRFPGCLQSPSNLHHLEPEGRIRRGWVQQDSCEGAVGSVFRMGVEVSAPDGFRLLGPPLDPWAGSDKFSKARQT